MKKVLSVILACLIFVSCSVCVFAAQYGDADELQQLRARFTDGVGPEVNGFALDYALFTPGSAETDGEKRPLVVWLHGMGEGAKPRAQLEKNNFVYWASDDFQSRFPTGGAYLAAVRSPEEKGLFWTSEMIEPLMALITELIATENIDASRVYLGGFSMGGKMTIRTAITYPNAFAAIFPICPASSFTPEQLEYIKDVPMWLTVSSRDVLAGWYTYSRDIWNNYCAVTSRGTDSRLSLLGRVCFPDGTKTISNHHAWYAVTYDMFTYSGDKYYNMNTVSADGTAMELTYPDGMISWLGSHTSSYAGEALTPSGGYPLTEKHVKSLADSLMPMLKSLVCVLLEVLTAACGL